MTRIAALLVVAALAAGCGNASAPSLVPGADPKQGAKLIEHNQPFTSLVRTVKSGTPLYYLPDQDAGRRHAVFAPFSSSGRMI